MSQENVELVRRGLGAFADQGFEAVMGGDYWGPEIVWDASHTGIPGFGVYEGLDEVRELFEDWFGAFPMEGWEIQIEELIDHGDQVVALLRQRGRGATSGAAAELEITEIFTLREGKIVRVDVYLDRVAALEAAGLSG